MSNFEPLQFEGGYAVKSQSKTRTAIKTIAVIVAVLMMAIVVFACALVIFFSLIVVVESALFGSGVSAPEWVEWLVVIGTPVLALLTTAVLAIFTPLASAIGMMIDWAKGRERVAVFGSDDDEFLVL